jgi:hypothetical protein
VDYWNRAALRVVGPCQRGTMRVCDKVGHGGLSITIARILALWYPTNYERIASPEAVIERKVTAI